MTGRAAQRGYLGIVANTVAIPAEIAQQAGLEQETGVMIFSVEPNSPARKAGLSMGDVLVEFNGKQSTTSMNCRGCLVKTWWIKKLKLTIIRKNSFCQEQLTNHTWRRKQ